MNNPTTYSVVIIVRLTRFPQTFERYGYHYRSIDDVVKHMDWARDQMIAQTKDGADKEDFELISNDVCIKQFNETQILLDPVLEEFSLPVGKKMPIGGRTFRSI